MVEDKKIPGMDLNNKKIKSPSAEESSKISKQEMEKTKKDLEKLKTFINKKWKYIQAISVLPPQSIKHFIEEEELPKESENKIHLQIIVPDEKSKQIPKIKQEIIEEIEKTKQNVWLHLRTPSEIWEICMDQKFELSSAIFSSFPIYDKGFLGALRVAEIHKSLVLQKFEKYVVSYVIAGSIVRGDITKDSDVDVFVVINDTDVKRMPRRELLERLRGIIYQYVAEASAIAGVKNKLEPQIYLLTDFWDAVKDAHPVMFTFIRDGVPLYDRGTFMPWKDLLKMGKLKPSPEAIDQFMSIGDDAVRKAKKGLLGIVIQDIYWSVITPAQAMFMLNGSPPPTHKEILNGAFRREFVTKEKMVEKKYADILEEIVKIYKDYEHEKVKEIKGAKIDRLIKNTEDYIKRLGRLRKQIEKKSQENIIKQIYGDVFSCLKTLIGNKSQEKLVKEFETNFVKKGKFSKQHLRILKGIIHAKENQKNAKSDPHKTDRVRRDADILLRDLIEFNQRKDLISLEKGKMFLKYDEKGVEKKAELLNCENASYLFKEDKVKKITNKIENTTMDEVNNAIKGQKGKEKVEVKGKVFDLLKKELGSFEIIM